MASLITACDKGCLYFLAYPYSLCSRLFPFPFFYTFLFTSLLFPFLSFPFFSFLLPFFSPSLSSLHFPSSSIFIIHLFLFLFCPFLSSRFLFPSSLLLSPLFFLFPHSVFIVEGNFVLMPFRELEAKNN